MAGGMKMGTPVQELLVRLRERLVAQPSSLTVGGQQRLETRALPLHRFGEPGLTGVLSAGAGRGLLGFAAQ